ncbi:MAG: GAF domain-containing protein, partial [Planctomycetota bacterium]|nr:GAF domain-containing protein [Planctomycetota bacterium]
MTAPGEDEQRLRHLASELLASPGRVEQGDLAAALGHVLKEAADALGACCAMLSLGGTDPAYARLVLSLGAQRAEPHLGTLPPYAQRTEPWPGVEATEGPPPAVLGAIAEANGFLLGGRGPGATDALPEDFPDVGPRIGCPIPGGEAAGGAVFLARAPDAPEFKPTDAAILSSLASLIALRVERARLRQESAAHERREAALAELAEACMSADSLREVLDTACEHIHRVLAADGTQVWMLDTAQRLLRLDAVRGIPTAGDVQEIPTDRTDLLAARVLAAGDVVRVTGADAVRAGLADPTAAKAGYTAAAAFPLVAHDRTYGTLTVYFRRTSGLGDANERFVKNVADLLAVAAASSEAQAERALSDAVFRTALANSPVPLIVYEDGGRIVGASRRVWDSLGLRREEIPDIDAWFERAFPDVTYRDAIRQRIEEPRAEGPEARSAGDAEVTCSDGSVRVWTIMHDVIENANHPTMHFLAALDVTEERQAQADLRQATKMEAVGRLAGGIAHDFNNLLTVISGYVDIALARLDSDHPAHRPVAEIALASEKASQVTEKLLAFARQRKPEPRPLDLNNVISNLMGMVGRVIGEGITCELELGHGVPAVQIDHGSLEQSLLNMFVNARDAMNGSGSIRVRTLQLQHGEVPPQIGGPSVIGPHALLLIEDNGCGMSEEVLSRIFEPF